MKTLIVLILLLSLIIMSCGFNLKSDPYDRYWFRFVLDMRVGEDIVIERRVFNYEWTAYQMMRHGVLIGEGDNRKFIHHNKFDGVAVYYADKREMPVRFENLQSVW